MERRWTNRTPISLDVDLFYQGIKVAECKTRDIGLNGVFLETDRRFPPEDAFVDVIFHLGALSSRTRYKIRARIVRMPPDGIGLTFRDFDATAFRSLQEIMHYRQNTLVEPLH